MAPYDDDDNGWMAKMELDGRLMCIHVYLSYPIHAAYLPRGRLHPYDGNSGKHMN